MSGFSPYGAVSYGAAPAYVAPSFTAAVEALFILSPRESDLAAYNASSAVDGLPVTNLQTIQPGRVWRSTDATPQYVDVAFAAPVAANALAIVGANVTAAGMFRVRGAATEANVTAAPAIDTGWRSMWPATVKPAAPDWPAHTSLLRWSNDNVFQYWRVEIADGGAVLSYLEAGRLVLGRAWQPTTNFDLGGTPLGFAPADVQQQTPWGRTFTDRRTPSAPRLFEVAIYAADKREAFDGIAEIQRLRGLWGDVICALDPGDSTDFHRFTMQGCFTAGGAYTLPPAFNANGSMFGAAIRLREFI